MRPVFADLVQEMQRTLGYYQSLNRDAKLTKVIGLGSTFKLPGLQKFLKQQLQMDVVRPDGFDRIGVEGKREADFADQALNLATAYGLALQGLGLEEVSANILPTHMIKQRLWAAKQPWIAAAALVMLVAVGAAWVRLLVDTRIFEGGLAATQPEVRRVLNDARKYKEQWSTVATKSDPRPRIENLRRVLDYRDVWPKLVYDLTLAARSLGPQDVLMEPDYDAIAALPAERRQRMYIESVSADYRFLFQDAGDVDGHGHRVEDVWGDLESAGRGSGGRGGSGRGDAADVYGAGQRCDASP